MKPNKKTVALSLSALALAFALVVPAFAKDGEAVDTHMPKHTGLDEMARADLPAGVDDNLPKHSGLDETA